MSWNICSYKDCMMQRKPCSSIAFFRLPQDEPRRTQWLVNSGNQQLRKLTASQVRYFCELHFHPLDIVDQFNRKLLRKHAVPKAHASLVEHDGGSPMQAIQIAADEEPQLEDDAEAATQWEELHHQNVEEHEMEVPVLAQELEKTEEESEQQKIEDDTYCVEYIVEDDSTEAINVVAAHTPLQDESAELVLELQSTAATSATDINKSVKTAETQVVASSSVSKAVSEDDDLHDEKYASDKHFALSLVYYFQRLSPEKKARAKIQILTYLTTLELGLEADLK